MKISVRNIRRNGIMLAFVMLAFAVGFAIVSMADIPGPASAEARAVV